MVLHLFVTMATDAAEGEQTAHVRTGPGTGAVASDLDLARGPPGAEGAP